MIVRKSIVAIFLCFFVSLSCSINENDVVAPVPEPIQETLGKGNDDPECHGEIWGFNLTDAARIEGGYPNVQFNMWWVIGCDVGLIYGYSFDIERISPDPASILVEEFVVPHGRCDPCLYFHSFILPIPDPNPKMVETYRIRLIQTWLSGQQDVTDWIQFTL